MSGNKQLSRFLTETATSAFMFKLSRSHLMIRDQCSHCEMLGKCMKVKEKDESDI